MRMLKLKDKKQKKPIWVLIGAAIIVLMGPMGYSHAILGIILTCFNALMHPSGKSLTMLLFVFAIFIPATLSAPYLAFLRAKYVLVPQLILTDEELIFAPSGRLRSRQFKWNQLFGVEFSEVRGSTDQILVVRATERYDKLETCLDEKDSEAAKVFILSKLPSEKLGRGFQILDI